MKYKGFIVIAVVAMIAMAVVYRVPAIRKYVVGS